MKHPQGVEWAVDDDQHVRVVFACECVCRREKERRGEREVR